MPIGPVQKRLIMLQQNIRRACHSSAKSMPGFWDLGTVNFLEMHVADILHEASTVKGCRQQTRRQSAWR